MRRWARHLFEILEIGLVQRISESSAYTPGQDGVFGGHALAEAIAHWDGYLEGFITKASCLQHLLPEFWLG
jgi:hypothetical protein